MLSMDLRKYDPAIARWTGIDPVTHHWQSTYSSFDGNPVFWADPSGASVEQTENGTTYTGEDAKVAFLNIRNQQSSSNGNCCEGFKQFFSDAAAGLDRFLNGGVSSDVPVGSSNYTPDRKPVGNNITGHYFGDAVFRLLGGETFSRALNGDPKAQFRVIAGAELSLLPGGRSGLVDDAAGAGLSKVFRVQGGRIPNASKRRFIFDGQGNMSISGDDMLFVTFNDQARAVQFLNKRGSNAELITFDVSKFFSDKIRANSLPQRLGRLNPGAPQQVDQSVTGNSFGIPKEYFNEFLNNISPGSIERIAK